MRLLSGTNRGHRLSCQLTGRLGTAEAQQEAHTMKRRQLGTLIIAALTASSLAAPALAHNPFSFNNSCPAGVSYNPRAGQYPVNYFASTTAGIDQHKNQLAARINQALAQGKISPRQAQGLTNDLNKFN